MRRGEDPSKTLFTQEHFKRLFLVLFYQFKIRINVLSVVPQMLFKLVIWSIDRTLAQCGFGILHTQLNYFSFCTIMFLPYDIPNKLKVKSALKSTTPCFQSNSQ